MVLLVPVLSTTTATNNQPQQQQQQQPPPRQHNNNTTTATPPSCVRSFVRCVRSFVRSFLEGTNERRKEGTKGRNEPRSRIKCKPKASMNVLLPAPGGPAMPSRMLLVLVLESVGLFTLNLCAYGYGVCHTCVAMCVGCVCACVCSCVRAHNNKQQRKQGTVL